MGLFDKITSGSKKKDAFYAEYADSHNLTRSSTPLPAPTRNLAGDVATRERFDGRLSTGFRGTVALVETTVSTTATVRTTDQDAAKNYWLPEGTETFSTETTAKAHPATVVMVSLEKIPDVLSGLAVKRNYNKQSMGKNDSYGELQRLDMAGSSLDDSYFVFVDEGSDSDRVRQLFTPSFSSWLNGRKGKFFGFEVGQGTLVTKHPGKFPKEAEEIDGYIAESCEIAAQLEEAAG